MMAGDILRKEGSDEPSEVVVEPTEAGDLHVPEQYVETNEEQLQQDDSSTRTPSLFSTGLNV